MLSVHRALAVALIVGCLLAALVAGYRYWRARGAGTITTHLLALAQTLLVAQVAVGLLLLSEGRRTADQLHYLYGTLALGAALTPWFYAPAEGPRRLLWFAATTALAAALGARAYMTGT
jgi:hypothetical protein